MKPLTPNEAVDPDRRIGSYPTLNEVQNGGPIELQRWMRFLPSPTDEQRSIMELIVDRYLEMKQKDPGAMVTASKAVGFDG